MSEKEVTEDYKVALLDLQVNSKPLITMLTMLADENKKYAPSITQVVVKHIKETIYKLPAMYLVDSIVKNVAHEYKRLFSNALASIFSTVFKAVDEKTRKKLYELRQTWNEVFPKSRLYLLDVTVHELDPAWPITSQPSVAPQTPHNIHINPNKFSAQTLKSPPASAFPAPLCSSNTEDIVTLKKLQTQKKVLEEERRMVEKMMQETSGSESLEKLPNIHVAPWKAKEMIGSVSVPTELTKTTGSPIAAPVRDPRLIPVGSAKDRIIGRDPEPVKDPRLSTRRDLHPHGRRIPSPKDPRMTSKSPHSTRDATTYEGQCTSANEKSSYPRSSEKDSSSTQRRDKKSRSEKMDKREKDDKSRNGRKSNEEKKRNEREKESKEVRNKEDKVSKEESERREKERLAKEEKEKTDKLLKERIAMEEKEEEMRNKAKMEEEKRLKGDTEELLKEEGKEKDDKEAKSKVKLNKDMKTKTDDEPSGKDNKKTSKSTHGKKKTGSPQDESRLDQDEKFKTQSNSRRRDHIRPRDKTIEVDALVGDASAASEESKGSSKESDKSKKRSMKEEAESDDSDHYEANKPPAPSYANKKAKSEIADGGQTNQEAFAGIPGADTDLRLLTSQPQAGGPSKVEEAKASGFGDLFGSSDTDLRQLAPPGVHFVSSQPPPPNTGILPGVVVVNPFASKDQDLRSARIPKIPRQGQENKDPRLRKVLEDEERLLNVSSSQSVLEDPRSRKPSFSSPHAAKWEKFREKNPEFKEYQRQASLSEKLERELGAQSAKFSPSHEVFEGKRKGRVREERRGRRVKARDQPLKAFDRDLREEDGFGRSEENYQFMISHLNDQINQSQITPEEYRNMMGNIRFTIEKDKIRQLQEQERGGGSPPDGSRWPADVRMERPGWVNSPFQEEENWRPWNRRRESGGVIPPHHRMRGLESKMEDDWTGEADLPSVSEDVMRAVTRESETRSIDIDGTPREIRTYGERAIILLDWDNPRVIEFEEVSCNVVFDEGQFALTMNTRDDYREIKIDGEVHRIKVGVPTQELMIDEKGYQCFFGGKPISVYLSDKNRTIRLDGRPPKVNIGPTKNFNYLAGKIELVINARRFLPLYLDAKPQKFCIDGVPFVIKFIDSFRAVSINGVKFPITFGGLPISISVRGFRKFLRFSPLPNEVVQGQISVHSMDADGATLIPSYPPSPPPSFPPQFSTPVGQMVSSNMPAMQTFKTPFSQGQTGSPFPGIQNPMMPISMGPSISGVVPGAYLTTGPVEQPSLQPQPVVPSLTVGDTTFQTPPTEAPPIDIHSLLNRLIKTGIIAGKKKDAPKDSKEKKTKVDKKMHPKDQVEETDEPNEEEDVDDLKDLPPVEHMFKLDNLRKRNDKLVARMYRGMQCSSCGLRYPPDLTPQYSHHLDWHFRMNKKQQESTRKVNMRKFYLCIDDWLQYEELEDIDERAPSMFEMENEDTSKKGPIDDEDIEEEIPSVAVSSDNPSLGVCPVCHETFDQFYHQNTEEWHYKYAQAVDGINYHSICHQDMLKSLQQEEERMKKQEEERLKKQEQERMKEQEEERMKKQEEDIKEEAVISVDEKEVVVEVEEENEVKSDDFEDQIVALEREPKQVEEIDLSQQPDIEDDSHAQKSEEPLRRKRATHTIKNGVTAFSAQMTVKEEPMDNSSDFQVAYEPRPLLLLADIPIKMEVPDEDEKNIHTFDVDDDEVHDTSVEEPVDPVWRAHSVMAETGLASSIDGNTELISGPENSQSTASVLKIKISVSKPITSLEEQRNGIDSNQNHIDAGFLDEFSDEFEPPPLSLKPAFDGIQLKEQPREFRGVELSSLCSIM